MFMAVDVGNTNTVYGLYRGKELVGSFRLNTDTAVTADEVGLTVWSYFSRFGHKPEEVEGILICSVTPGVMGALTVGLEKYFGRKPLVVDVDVDPGLPYGLEGKERLGADRAVACVAAMAKYGAPLVVLDFGTATKVDAVSREGKYMGGCIATGMAVSAQALAQKAALLPDIDLACPEKVLNSTAVGHIQAGVVLGHIGAAEYLVRRAKAELGEPEAKVIATGGLSGVVAQGMELIDALEPDLILEGLRLLWEKRVKSEE